MIISLPLSLGLNIHLRKLVLSSSCGWIAAPHKSLWLVNLLLGYPSHQILTIFTHPCPSLFRVPAFGGFIGSMTLGKQEQQLMQPKKHLLLLRAPSPRPNLAYRWRNFYDHVIKMKWHLGSRLEWNRSVRQPAMGKYLLDSASRDRDHCIFPKRRDMNIGFQVLILLGCPLYISVKKHLLFSFKDRVLLLAML